MDFAALITLYGSDLQQVQAFVGIGWDGLDERYYVWEDDETQNIGCKKRNDKKMFGVCDNLWQVRLRNRAISSLGAAIYTFEDELEGRYGFSGLDGNTDKCNYFVAYCIRAEDLLLDPQHGYFLYSSYPPTANDWAYETAINHWIYLGFGAQVLVQPGYVVGHPAQPHGHCGIVDFDGWVISAGAQQVNRKYPLWLDGTTGYNKYGEIDE